VELKAEEIDWIATIARNEMTGLVGSAGRPDAPCRFVMETGRSAYQQIQWARANISLPSIVKSQ
jgi:hypothetical protein